MLRMSWSSSQRRNCAPPTRRGRTTSVMADSGLRWWRRRRGEVGSEGAAWCQNSGARYGAQFDRYVGPHACRGASRGAGAPGRAPDAGCVLVARLARSLSHEGGQLCGVLVRRSVVTRVHVARGGRLREQADAHREPTACRGDGHGDDEGDASQGDWRAGGVVHGHSKDNTRAYASPSCLKASKVVATATPRDDRGTGALPGRGPGLPR